VRIVGCADAELIVPGGIVWAARCGVLEHVVLRRAVQRRVDVASKPRASAAAAPPSAAASSAAASSAAASSAAAPSSPPRSRALDLARGGAVAATELTPSKASPFFRKRSREAAVTAAANPHCFVYAGAGGAARSSLHLRHCSFDNSGGRGACVGCFASELSRSGAAAAAPTLGASSSSSSSSLGVKREAGSGEADDDAAAEGVHVLFAVDCDFVHAPSGSSGVALGSGMIGAFSDCGMHHNGGNGITLMTGSALILRGSSVHDNGCVSLSLCAR
jgi:hypothetical protein